MSAPKYVNNFQVSMANGGAIAGETTITFGLVHKEIQMGSLENGAFGPVGTKEAFEEVAKIVMNKEMAYILRDAIDSVIHQMERDSDNISDNIHDAFK